MDLLHTRQPSSLLSHDLIVIVTISHLQVPSNGNDVDQPDLLLGGLYPREDVLHAASGKPHRDHPHASGDRGYGSGCPAHRLHGEHHSQHRVKQLRQRSQGHGMGRGKAQHRDSQHLGQPRQAQERDQRTQRHRRGQPHPDGQEVHRRTSADPSSAASGARRSGQRHARKFVTKTAKATNLASVCPQKRINHTFD